GSGAVSIAQKNNSNGRLGRIISKHSAVVLHKITLKCNPLARIFGPRLDHIYLLVAKQFGCFRTLRKRGAPGVADGFRYLFKECYPAQIKKYINAGDRIVDLIILLVSIFGKFNGPYFPGENRSLININIVYIL